MVRRLNHMSLQSRTYSVRFGTWKVRRLNQALGSTHGAPSESYVAPVSLQSRTYISQLGSAHEKYGVWTSPWALVLYRG